MMKKITILWALLVNMVAFAQVPTNGLVCYWPFNGNANDASGNSRNGAVSGATLATGKSGIANTAYYFNGSSTINLSNTSSLPLAGNTDWTIYARSKISNGGGGPLFMKQTSSATTIQYVWILGSSNNTITGGLGTDSFINGGWANTLNTSNPQNSFADNWNSNFIVKRGDTTYFYTENKLAYKTKFAWLDRPVGDQNIVLGRTWFDNWHLIGFIDEFAIWNRVLNIAEIMQVAGIVNQTIAGFSLPQTLNYSASPIMFNATASSGLPITYSSSNSSIIEISGNVASVAGVGLVSITATQIGNATTAGASISNIVTITKANLTIVNNNIGVN